MPKQPQPVTLDSSRRSVHEIFEGVSRNAREELNRSSRALAFSGLAGGVTMGLTGLAVAIVQALLGAGQPGEFISYLFYPVGFIAVIIGRAQLFTENTLTPILPLLRKKPKGSRRSPPLVPRMHEPSSLSQFMAQD